MSAIPVYIPYVNRPDLLARAVASVPRRGIYRPVVINNSPRHVDVPADHIQPDAPMTFARTQNFMHSQAVGLGVPFYMFMHSDAEAEEGTIDHLYELALHECMRRKWGAIFTAYDALAAYSTAAMTAIGGWDEELEWYLGDCDCYRRLRLAGYPTIDSGLPVKHTPSQTLNSDPEIARRVAADVGRREAYYQAKWGGGNEKETYTVPWNGERR